MAKSYVLALMPLMAAPCLFVGCDKTANKNVTPPPTPPGVVAAEDKKAAADTAGDVDQAMATGDADMAQATGDSDEAAKATPEEKILSRRKAIRGAPEWTAVVARTVSEGDTRYLLTTGVSKGVGNPALARTRAENRARAEAAKLLGAERLQGVQVMRQWNGRKKTFVSEVRTMLPEDSEL